MAYRYSQLIGIRDYAKETKDRISNLYGMMSTNEMIEQYDADIIGDIFDDIGHVCDETINFCNLHLKLLDARKEKEAVGSISPRSSRWY